MENRFSDRSSKPSSIFHPPSSMLLFGLGGLVFVCVAGLVIAAFPRLPLQQQWARERWEQRRPRHYELDVAWANGMSFGHVRAELLDGQIVAGVNLDTGRPLERNQLIAAGFYASIDNLFRTIDSATRPEGSWRSQLARYHPLLARWLDPCAALLPQISFDPQFGYPSSISYRGSPCFDGGNINLTIDHFRVLP